MSEEKKYREEAGMEHREEERSHHEHHHSEHHHSEHHHSEHHRSRKKKKRKAVPLPKFMKKKKFWVNVGVVAAAAVLMIGIGLMADHRQKDQTDPGTRNGSSEKQWVEEGSVSVSVTFFGEDVSLLGEGAVKLMDSDTRIPTDHVLESLWDDDRRLDVSNPVVLNYDISGLGAAYAMTGAVIEVSEQEDFRNPILLEQDRHARSVKIQNLKTDTDYFYRVTIRLTGEKSVAVQGSFRTERSARILTVDGAANVRDMGGWKNSNGQSVRQGMIYRGSELDGAVEPGYKLTAAGLEEMLRHFGIRTELDLRSETDNVYGTDTLGAGVEHIYYGMPMYTEIFSDWGRSQMREICAVLADESNYPVYIHCTYGMDRTGTVCALLEALLGLRKEDLLKDYRLSALHHYVVNQDQFERFLAQLETYDGYSLQEKTENFLLSAGVTKSEIEQIRGIMLQ